MSAQPQWQRDDAYGQPAGAGEPARARRHDARTEPLLLAGACLIGYAVLAWYLTLRLHIQYIDTLARVADAYYVGFSHDPHLAALGFVWPPLPSLVVFPLLFLNHLWPALTWYGFAGNIESAVFGAISVLFMNRVLRTLGIPGFWRVAMTLAYALNPMIALYSGDGMSETMLICFFLIALFGVLEYLRTGSVANLAAAGAALGTAMFVRYEAVPLALALGVGLAIALWMERKPSGHVEGALILLLAPIAFTGSLWMYANWLIMGNPLYFAKSNYSNSAQVSAGFFNTQTGAAAAAHSVVKSLVYAGQYYQLFWPVVVGLAAAVFILLRRQNRDRRAPMLIMAALAVPVLQAVLTYIHQTAGWDRFYIYIIPTGVVLLAFAASQFKRPWLSVACAGALALVVAGGYSTLKTMENPYLGNMDHLAVQNALSGTKEHPYSNVLQLVHYIDARPHMRVLMESFQTVPVYLRVANPKQIITNSDRAFVSDLDAPLGRVGYFLLPPINREDQLVSTIAKVYPGLWSGKPVSWARLVKTFPPVGFRLYKITAQPPVLHDQ